MTGLPKPVLSSHPGEKNETDIHGSLTGMVGWELPAVCPATHSSKLRESHSSLKPLSLPAPPSEWLPSPGFLSSVSASVGGRTTVLRVFLLGGWLHICLSSQALGPPR